ncbi:lipoprotein LprG [Marmoricola sp. URHA0025 HA25]
MTADRRRASRAGAGIAVAVALLSALAGCGGGSKADAPKGADATKVLAVAKKHFDDAASVHLVLATTSRPTSGDAVLGADGTLTHQPAFDGKVKVVLSGFTADVPIVAVDGKVYAKLPLTPKYATIDPAEYGAPDPAEFADTSKGISGLLLKIADVKEAGTAREGKQVVTRYSGTLSGSYVAPIIPSADDSGTYKTVMGLDQDDRLVTLEITGEFFSGGGDETYTISFDDYDKSVKISAP